MEEVLEVIKEAERQGWTVTATAKNHRKFVSPEGAIVVTGGTPSDWRSFRNLTTELRREGLDLANERRAAPRRRHPSAAGIEKMEVPERDVDSRMLAAGIYSLLEDGPLSEGMLVHALRSEGMKVGARDLAGPLRTLIKRRTVRLVGSEYARVARLPPRPRPAKGTHGDVWCVDRKGLWHCTQHNNKPSGPFRSLCGYPVEVTEVFERRRPDCPFCLEKLETIVFL